MGPARLHFNRHHIADQLALDQHRTIGSRQSGRGHARSAASLLRLSAGQGGEICGCLCAAMSAQQPADCPECGTKREQNRHANAHQHGR